MGRVRSHVLEDESRTQFRLTVPSQWVVRDKPSDYGIDCEVEIFNKEGSPTGLVFWVQIKATDSKIKKTKQSFRFKADKLDQFRNYSIPVLLARYSSDEKRFYILWSNRARLISTDRTLKSINVNFPDETVWDDDTPKSIKTYLNKLNLVKRGTVHLPIQCFIALKNVSMTQIARMRRQLAEFSSVIRLSRKEADANLLAYINEDKITLSLMDELGVSFGFGKDKFTGFSSERLYEPFVLGCLIIFADAHKPDLVKEVIEKADLKDVIRKYPDILKHLVPCLLSGIDFESNLLFIHEYLKETNDSLLDTLTSSILLLARRSANEENKKVIQRYLENKVYLESDNDNNQRKAAYLYNLGDFHKSQGDYFKAFHYFNRARKKDSNY